MKKIKIKNKRREKEWKTEALPQLNALVRCLLKMETLKKKVKTLLILGIRDSVTIPI